MTKTKKTGNAKKGKKKKDVQRASSEIGKNVESNEATDENEELSPISTTTAKLANCVDDSFAGMEMRCLADYSLYGMNDEFPTTYEGFESHPSLILAKARLLVLWVAFVPRPLYSLNGLELTSLAVAVFPVDMTEQLITLAQTLYDQGMLKETHLTDLHLWRRQERLKEVSEPANVLNQIEWMRRRIQIPDSSLKSQNTQKGSMPDFLRCAPNEDDEDIYDFGYLETKNEFRDFGHSTGMVSGVDWEERKPLLSQDSPSDLSGPERALSVFVQVLRTQEPLDRSCSLPALLTDIREEAKHLLSPAESCLLMCFLKDKANRNPSVQIQELSDALKQVSLWSDQLVDLLDKLKVSDQDTIRDLVKTSYFNLMLLPKTPGESLEVIRSCRACGLFHLTRRDETMLAEREKSFKWSQTQTEGERLWHEGEFAECKAHFERAVREPSVFSGDSMVALDMIKKCELKLKKELKAQPRCTKIKEPRSIRLQKKPEVSEPMDDVGKTELDDVVQYACSLSEDEFRKVLLLGEECRTVLLEGVHLQDMVEKLSMGMEGLHDHLAHNSSARGNAPLRPSESLPIFKDRLRTSWPCHHNIARLLPRLGGEPHKLPVFECRTCRSTDCGKLSIACELCSAVHHGNHRLQPFGQMEECDDSHKISPWCPELLLGRDEGEAYTLEPPMIQSVVASTEGGLRVGLATPEVKDRAEYIRNIFKSAGYCNNLKACVESTNQKRFTNVSKWVDNWQFKFKEVDSKIISIQNLANAAEEVIAQDAEEDIERGDKQVEATRTLRSAHEWATGSLEARDDSDCLEAGVWEQKRAHIDTQGLYDDLRRAKQDRMEFELSVPLDLRGMTIDLWVLRVLHQRYILSAIASTLRTKLVHGCSLFKEEAARLAERRQNEEADAIARALEAEEETVSKRSAGHEPKKRQQKDKGRNRGQKDAAREAAQKAQEMKNRRLREAKEEEARLIRREQYLAEQIVIRRARDSLLAEKEKERLELERLTELALKESNDEALSLSRGEQHYNSELQQSVITVSPKVEADHSVHSEITSNVARSDSLVRVVTTKKNTKKTQTTNRLSERPSAAVIHAPSHTKGSLSTSENEVVKDDGGQAENVEDHGAPENDTERDSGGPMAETVEFHGASENERDNGGPNPGTVEYHDASENETVRDNGGPIAETVNNHGASENEAVKADGGQARAENIKHNGASENEAVEYHGAPGVDGVDYHGGVEVYDDYGYAEQGGMHPVYYQQPPMMMAPVASMYTQAPVMMMPNVMPIYFVPPPNGPQPQPQYMNYPMMQGVPQLPPPYFDPCQGSQDSQSSHPLAKPHLSKTPKKSRKKIAPTDDMIESLLAQTSASWVTRDHAIVLLGWSNFQVQDAVAKIAGDDTGELKCALDSQLTIRQYKLKNRIFKHKKA